MCRFRLLQSYRLCAVIQIPCACVARWPIFRFPCQPRGEVTCTARVDLWIREKRQHFTITWSCSFPENNATTLSFSYALEGLQGVLRSEAVTSANWRCGVRYWGVGQISLLYCGPSVHWNFVAAWFCARLLALRRTGSRLYKCLVGLTALLLLVIFCRNPAMSLSSTWILFDRNCPGFQNSSDHFSLRCLALEGYRGYLMTVLGNIKAGATSD